MREKSKVQGMTTRLGLLRSNGLAMTKNELSFRPSEASGEIYLTDVSTSLDMTIEYDNGAGIAAAKVLAMTRGDSEPSSE